MTKSQNTKSEQLTEQWKKGELPEGHYYVKDGENMIAEYIDGYFYNDGNPMTSFSGGVDEIIAPVPSYEEWKGKDDALTSLLAEYGKLTKELQDEKEKHMTRFSLRSPADEVIIEKQVWESTLHRSMVLQAENEELKEIIERHKKATAKAQIRSCDLEIINAQLKELLKECKEPLEVLAEKRDACEWCPEDLLAKIDEVLK
jgi:hypothetical protein